MAREKRVIVRVCVNNNLLQNSRQLFEWRFSPPSLLYAAICEESKAAEAKSSRLVLRFARGNGLERASFFFGRAVVFAALRDCCGHFYC